MALNSSLWFSHFAFLANPFFSFFLSFSLSFSFSFSFVFLLSCSFFPWNTFSQTGTCLAYDSLLNFLLQYGHLYKICSLFASSGSSSLGITSTFFGSFISFFVVIVFSFIFSKSISNEIPFFFIWLLKFPYCNSI